MLSVSGRVFGFGFSGMQCLRVKGIGLSTPRSPRRWACLAWGFLSFPPACSLVESSSQHAKFAFGMFWVCDGLGMQKAAEGLEA